MYSTNATFTKQYNVDAEDGDFRLSAVSLRTELEKMVNEYLRCANARDFEKLKLADRILMLKKKNIFSSEYINGLYVVKSVGNLGAHGEKVTKVKIDKAIKTYDDLESEKEFYKEKISEAVKRIPQKIERSVEVNNETPKMKEKDYSGKIFGIIKVAIITLILIKVASRILSPGIDFVKKSLNIGNTINMEKVKEDFVSNALNTFKLDKGEKHRPGAAIWLQDKGIMSGKAYSSNENVVTVSDTGTVTAKGSGVAYVVIKKGSLYQAYKYIVN